MGRAYYASHGRLPGMAWSKGFFRLWIVLTLVWIVAVAAGLGKDEFKGLWQPSSSIEVEYKGGIKDTLDSSRRPEDLRRQIVGGVSKGAILLQKSDPAEARKQIDGANGSADELLKILSDENEKRADRLHRALTILLTPPAALLIVGIAIAWVASGFRRKA
jgi:hypothetical protein